MEYDKEILEDINKAIGSNRPLTYLKTNMSRYSKIGQFSISISNRKIATKLYELGMRSKNNIPAQIPSHLRHHFIRGVFDGDGCISISRKRKSGEVHFMGEYSLLKEIMEELSLHSIDILSEPKFIRNIYRIRKSGNNNIRKIYNYLYNDATIYLKRKYDKFAVLTQKSQKS